MTAAGRSGPAVTLVAGDDGVAWMTLRRPHLDADVMAGLVDACAAAEDAAAARVVVLTAAGPDFCRGLPAEVAWPPAAWADGVAALAALTRPVVACLRGRIAGWGVGLALACDVRLAAANAVLQVAGASSDRLCGGGTLARLARAVGPARALELALLEEPLEARRALAWGLVTRVAPAARLHAAAGRVAQELARRGPQALALAKETVVRALDLPLDAGLRLEHDCYALLQTTADRAEGIAAFLEHRAPRFAGR